MPQNPIPSALFVTKIVGGGGVSVLPLHGTGIVTVSVEGAGAPLVVNVTSATPATTHAFDTETVVSAAAVSVAGNGNIASLRGNTTINSGTTLNRGYFYGAEGKVTCAGIVVLGSDYLTGVLGQLNLSGATVTSGHVAAVIANIQNPVASANVDGIYVESSGPAVINSALKSIANTSFVFDLSSDSGASACINTTGTAGATTAKGWLKVMVNDGTNAAVARYIPLTDSVT